MIGEILEPRELIYNRRVGPGYLRGLQDRELHAIIRHAYEKVPYYHSLFKSVGLALEDIQMVEDLKYVSIATKMALKSTGKRVSQLQSRIQEQLGEPIRLDIQIVDSIPLDPPKIQDFCFEIESTGNGLIDL